MTNTRILRREYLYIGAFITTFVIVLPISSATLCLLESFSLSCAFSTVTLFQLLITISISMIPPAVLSMFYRYQPDDFAFREYL